MNLRLSPAALRQSSILLLSILFLTCRPNADEGFGPNGEPRILEMTLPGVPAQNVRIDQETGQISITLPAALPSLEFTPSFRFTPDSRVLKIPGDFKSFGFNLCNGPDFPPFTVIGGGSKTKNYTLAIQAGGALAIGTLPTPFEAGLNAGQCLSLPVLHFYDGTPNSGEVTFIRKDRGLRSTATISCSSESQPNQFSVCLPPDLTIGEYTLELKKANGRTVTVSQPLVVKKGIPSIGYDYYYPPVVGEKTLKLSGWNLFDGDGYEALLTNRAGTEYRLKPTDFQPTGQAKFDLSSLPVGNYFVRLLHNGQLTSGKTRVSILKEKTQPAIHTFDGLMGDLPDPIRLRRDEKHNFIFTPIGSYGSTAPIRLKFSPIAGGQALTVNVNAESYVGCGPDCGVPSFRLPAAFPAGRYVLTLLIEPAGGISWESEPLERDVVVE